MAIVINGSGTVTGLAVGGLPDGTVDAGTVAADVATQAEIDAKLNLAGGTMSGALTLSSGDVGIANNQAFRSGGQALLARYDPIIEIGSGDGQDYLKFKAGASERMRISTSGVVSIPVGIELGSGVDGTAANTLDDYEEGNWTPAWVVANGTVTSATPTGKYTKIGRTVFIWGFLSFGSQSSTTGSDNLKLGGLPFTPGNGWGQGNSYTGGVHTIGLYNWATGKAPDYSFFTSSSSHNISRKTGTTETNVLVSDFNTSGNYSQFRFQGQYNIA